MGIITEISAQKNKKRVNIFVDGEFVSGLSFETAVKHGLKKGVNINEEKLSQIIEESEELSAFATGLDMVAVSNKTSNEIKQKLIKKGFCEKIATLAVEKLKEYKYVDDLSFAKSYVKVNSSKSKRELENKLKAKGISLDDIKVAIALVSEDDEKENALNYARKYMTSKSFDDRTKNNLFAGLVRKGYNVDTIYSVIEIVKREKVEE